MTEPFMYLISPLVQIAVKAMNNLDQIERLAAGTAEQIAGNAEVSRSLKVPKLPGTTLMRQIDIRATPESPVVLVTYTCWDHARCCWRVFMESPHEKYFEQSRIHEELN